MEQAPTIRTRKFTQPPGYGLLNFEVFVNGVREDVAHSREDAAGLTRFYRAEYPHANVALVYVWHNPAIH